MNSYRVLSAVHSGVGVVTMVGAALQGSEKCVNILDQMAKKIHRKLLNWNIDYV